MKLTIREGVHSLHGKTMDTNGLRENFLITDLFASGGISMTYTHIDRMIAGGICPTDKPLLLEAGAELRADYFLQRRELGAINIGGPGRVSVDGKTHDVGPREAVYLSMGVKELVFSSIDPKNPAKYYFNSAPAHRHTESRIITKDQAKRIELGSDGSCNKRTIFQLIHPDILETCQLVMGMTSLATGSVWNTMPCHTHERRMEVYLYLDLPEDGLVFHFMGPPSETRHLVVRNEQAVISPSWSIHSGVGTRNYTFIWGMVGENQTFSDMDQVPMTSLV
ncbi:MAG: 5-dehydro-4-deoxy-D-glucuronate isomerase [Spirochaetota bacterium]